METIVAHPPKAGAKVQVIGAGMPRTGTNSFCAALEILLDGPAYHVGVQTATSGDESHVLTFIDILERRPYRSPKEKQEALDQIAKRLDGYIATADPPASQLIPELMELFPDAKVICTTRDIDSWAESMAVIVKTVQPRLQRFIFFWIPIYCRLPRLWTLLPKIFDERYGRQIENKESAVVVWDRHHAWLEEIVPKNKLFYVDVKDGWGPLCKALDVPVPQDVPFPRLNDSKSFENIFKQWAIQGLIRWAMVVALGVLLSSVGMALWVRRK